MSRIRILPDEVVNKIAAGEVVERPASVLKELLENSLDAASTTVRITVRGAGVKTIRVEDDGEGMDREDLLLALERHSTSKLRGFADLAGVSTFGFRGEALPSIAAVSEMTITSRKASDLAAVRVETSGGIIKEVTETGSPPGTTVEVRKLFFNTPPRRKFLRSPATELSHIVQETLARALARPEVAFHLRDEDRVVFDFPPAAGLAERLSDAWGKDKAIPLLLLEGEDAGFSVSGFISSPETAVGYRKGLYIFVNRRPVSDRVIFSAVMDGCAARLSRGRYPTGVLFLEAAPGLVDFNVHPAKKEVKFACPLRVRELVKRATVSALLRSPPARSFYPVVERETIPKVGEDKEFTTVQAVLKLPSRGGESPEPLAPEERIVGQLRGTYLVVETAAGALVVDQHAAHERVLYEEFRRAMLSASAEKQVLLSPLTVELSPRAAAALAEMIPRLRSLGIEIEPFGRDVFAVTALPSILGSRPRQELVIDVLAGIEEWSGTPSDPREEVIKSLACREAVKARHSLSAPAGAVLWERLKRCGDPAICPHGRPVTLKLTWEEMERRFGRR